MKGSSRSAMKEESTSASKSRIGTRSAGRLNITSSRSRPRTVKSATSSPRAPVPRSSRSVSPGSSVVNLKTKRARLEKEKETVKLSKPADTTPRNVATPSTEQNLSDSQVSQGSQSAQNTPKGAGIRTRLSTGSIHMNGTMTVSAAKEKAELDQIMKQIAKTDSLPAAKISTSAGKKRVAQAAVNPNEVVSPDHPPPKKRKIGRNDGSGEDNCNDYFCWLCHKEGMLVCCELCPRVYHTRCLGLNAALPQDWVCPECEKVMRAECVDTRSKAMEMLTIDQLCTLLKYALERMKHAGSEPFQKPVDLNAVPNYFDYVFHPMDLSTLEKNIKKKLYGCTEAFLADAKWILHNCIIYNGAHSKLTTSAKMIIKICKHEMNEIELCPDCYLNSCVRKNDEWFSETCRVPHTLVWAKLKGYPFWPSKALREVDGQVDVRFFGAHDRSWVPVSQCFLLSKNIPTSLQKGKKNNGLDMAIQELNLHVKKLRERFGNFEYAPFRTPYDKTDSYKPISLKPEHSKNTGNSSVRLTQNKDNKTGNSSAFASLKPNILRKSAVAKIRSKYSAMVSLRKIDMSPNKVKKKVEDEVAEQEFDGNTASENDSKLIDFNQDEQESDNDIDVETTDEKEGSKNDSKELKSLEDRTKEKAIKKTFVSSNLIERIESKLKALKDDPEKAPAAINSVESGSETSEVYKTEESLVKENEVGIDKAETEQLSEIGKDNSCRMSEVDKTQKTVHEVQSQICTEKENKEVENMQIVQDEELKNKEQDKVKEFAGETEKESKDSYRKKLDTMIKSCKEKLGIENEEMAEIDSVVSDEIDEEDVGSSDEEEEVDSGEYYTADSETEDTGDNDQVEEEAGSKSDTEKELHSAKENHGKNSVDEESTDVKSESKTVVKSTGQKPSEHIVGTDMVDGDKKETGASSPLSAKPTQSVSECKTFNASEECEQQIHKDTDSTEKNVNKSDPVVSVKEPSSETAQQTEAKTKETTSSSLSENKTESIETNVSVSSVKSSKQVVEAESQTEKVGFVLSQSVVGKSFSGELTDSSMVDEDSENDRLVIDLEEKSPLKKSTPGLKVKSFNKNTLKSPEQEAKNVVEEVKNIQTYSPKSEDKDSNKTGETTKFKTNKDLSVEKETQNGRKSSETENESLSIKVKCQLKDLEEKTQSEKLETESQSKVLVGKAQSMEFDVLKSKKLKEKAQSREPDNVALSKTSPGRTQSKESSGRTQSVEEMEVDDDVEVIDELSSVPLDSDLPVNTDSSLPDKNFVRPHCTDIPKDVSTGSKVAEKFSQKLLKTIQKTMDDMYVEIMKEKQENRSVDVLNKSLNQAKWDYCQELNELKHNFQLTMLEMKAGWESEKEQLIKALTAKHQAEKELAVKETKKKQWCAQCGKEAIFYCCWNTSYCDYPCQQSHWPQHMHTCLQTNKDKTTSTTTSSSQEGQGQVVSQSTSSIPVSIGPSVAPQTSVAGTPTPVLEQDPLRQLQDNISRAIHREEEKRGEGRPGISPKFSSPMPSPLMQNIRQPGPGSMMFNMQPQPQPGVMQQLQRTRFIGQQQMAMQQVQQRVSVPQSQQGSPRMLFSQPLIQHAVYPVQVQQPQQIGGTILFQNAQQMPYGMPPRPY